MSGTPIQIVSSKYNLHVSGCYFRNTIKFKTCFKPFKKSLIYDMLISSMVCYTAEKHDLLENRSNKVLEEKKILEIFSSHE